MQPASFVQQPPSHENFMVLSLVLGVEECGFHLGLGAWWVQFLEDESRSPVGTHFQTVYSVVYRTAMFRS